MDLSESRRRGEERRGEEEEENPFRSQSQLTFFPQWPRLPHTHPHPRTHGRNYSTTWNHRARWRKRRVRIHLLEALHPSLNWYLISLFITFPSSMCCVPMCSIAGKCNNPFPSLIRKLRLAVITRLEQIPEESIITSIRFKHANRLSACFRDEHFMELYEEVADEIGNSTRGAIVARAGSTVLSALRMAPNNCTYDVEGEYTAPNGLATATQKVSQTANLNHWQCEWDSLSIQS